MPGTSLKCQFHSHAAGDKVDVIRHSPKQLIDKAAHFNYDVLAITSHRTVIFNKKLQKYAAKKNIILIPGTEFEINGKHILGINIDNDILKVDSFAKLAAYKKSHPNCLIVAPHPFFPGPFCLKKALIENITIFDAIEISFAYTKTKNYNREAIELAHRWKKPLIATSDCHILKYLDLGYTLVKATKNTKSIIVAIKDNKVQPIHHPTTYLTIASSILRVIIPTLASKLKKLFR